MVQNIISFEVFHFIQTLLHQTELCFFVEANKGAFECVYEMRYVAIMKYELTELLMGDSFDGSMS